MQLCRIKKILPKKVALAVLLQLMYIPSVWCDVGSQISAPGFLTSMPPATPVPHLPADGSEGLPLRVAVTWKKVIHASHYELQTSGNGDFASDVTTRTGLADTLAELADLANNSRYYWRVAASNVAGKSDYSSILVFSTIIAAPLSPSLSAPADNAKITGDHTQLIWRAAGSGNTYHVQLAATPEFNEPLREKNAWPDTTWQISGLAYGQTYYWRVQAANIAGISPFSPIRSFTALIAPPAAPQLHSPVNGKRTAALEIDFYWAAVDSADTYHLQISTHADFSVLQADTAGFSQPTCHIGELDYLVQYYWRVSAVNAGGEGIFSNPYSFRTGATAIFAHSTTELPTHLALLPNYPNPFNPQTTITFTVPDQTLEQVTVSVYNSCGQMVRRLHDGPVAAGIYSVIWDGRDFSGHSVGSGIYVCRLQAGGRVMNIKMMYVR